MEGLIFGILRYTFIVLEKRLKQKKARGKKTPICTISVTFKKQNAIAHEIYCLLCKYELKRNLFLVNTTVKFGK